MEKIKNELDALLTRVKIKNEELYSLLNDKCFLTDYEDDNGIWTNALQRALNEHEVVIIPSSNTPYVLDGSVIIPSNRRIIAESGAIVRLSDTCKLLMLRNKETKDGTHMPITAKRDENVSIEGGIWEESCTHRLGYGGSGMYDEKRSFFGVSV